MDKTYHIFLDEKKIGTTQFENADPPMGVVFGRINFVDIESGYAFFKKYCQTNSIEFTDYPTDKLIMTDNILGLKVIDSAETEIKGIGTSISGMDNDFFDITIIGISYPFYEEEFPHHRKNYDESFKEESN